MAGASALGGSSGLSLKSLSYVESDHHHSTLLCQGNVSGWQCSNIVFCLCYTRLFPKREKFSVNSWRIHTAVFLKMFSLSRSQSTCCEQSMEAWSTRPTHSFILHENPQALTCFRAFQKFTFGQKLKVMLARRVLTPTTSLQLPLPAPWQMYFRKQKSGGCICFYLRYFYVVYSTPHYKAIQRY